MSVARIKLYLAQVDFPCDLAQLGDLAYLVGGSVRDALLQRYKVPLDLDFVLPEKAIATAKRLANLHHGGFVVLDQAREIARVVFEQGTLDLANQEGSTLETDLNRRDFTVNAIAYNIQSAKLVDPLGGVQDLAQKVLRMVSAKNLEDDPLRLLRAYRQAAQLGFTIETQTRTAICDRVSLLDRIAAERVQAELNYIFTAPQGNKWLVAAVQDGLLNFWLPNATQVDLEQLEAVTRGIVFCSKSNLNCLDLTMLAKLSTLVTSEPDTAEEELTDLKYPRAQIKAVTKTVKYLPQLRQMTQLMNLREQYFWFQEVKDIFPILITRAISLAIPRQIIDPLIKRYLDPTDLVVYPKCLVTGNDLMQELNLKPSPVIGELLTEIQLAQIESKIFTTQQAINFASSWIQSVN
jgi:tRNA nucleotidyltransferase (CCA-adding enzyme)